MTSSKQSLQPSTTGYSGKSLPAKLGIKESTIGQIIGAPKDVLFLYGTLPDGIRIATKPGGSNDLIHVYSNDLKILQRTMLVAKSHIKSNGMIWVSWPKKSSGVKTDITEGDIRDFALSHGLVDIKVCAVNEIWSGLKLVIPVSLRK